jgi:hypothetical protein
MILHPLTRGFHYCNFSSRLPVVEDTFEAPMLNLFLVMNDLLPIVGNNEMPIFDRQIVGERAGGKHLIDTIVPWEL